jgi:hypothetical protein
VVFKVVKNIKLCCLRLWKALSCSVQSVGKHSVTIKETVKVHWTSITASNSSPVYSLRKTCCAHWRVCRSCNRSRAKFGGTVTIICSFFYTKRLWSFAMRGQNNAKVIQRCFCPHTRPERLNPPINKCRKSGYIRSFPCERYKRIYLGGGLRWMFRFQPRNRFSLCRGLSKPQISSENNETGRNRFPLPGIELRFLACPGNITVTTLITPLVILFTSYKRILHSRTWLISEENHE